MLQLGSLYGIRLHIQGSEDEKAPSAFSQPTSIDLLSSLSELRVPREEVLPAAHEMEKLNWLFRAARQLNEGGAIDEILKVFLHLALQLTGLERGFVFLREGGQMRLAQGLNSDGKSVEEDSRLFEERCYVDPYGDGVTKKQVGEVRAGTVVRARLRECSRESVSIGSIAEILKVHTDAAVLFAKR